MKPFYSNQYAYRERVSAEMALHEFVCRVETQLELENYAVTVFMDVEDAFSHTSLQIICEVAASRGVPRPMYLLGASKTNSYLGGYQCSGTHSTGSPQGGLTTGLEANVRWAALLAE